MTITWLTFVSEWLTDYSIPWKKKYVSYKLVNFDQDWVTAGNTNFARYRLKLAPGNYEFQVNIK